jgi:hypothetical protein
MRRSLASSTELAARLVLLALASSGCTCDDSVTYKGSIAGPSSESATLSIFQPRGAGATEKLTGSLDLGPGIGLTGTLDTTTSVVQLSGGGYTLTGKLEKETISGSYSGPKGGGSFAAQSTASSKVTVYCGTFGGMPSGVWNLNVSADGAASGSYSDRAGEMEGNVVGTVSDGALKVYCGVRCTAIGTMTGTRGSGTWTAGEATGTWVGSTHCP